MRGFGLIVALLLTVTEVSAVRESEADALVVRRPLVGERCFRSTAVDSVIAVMQDRLL